MQLQCGLHLYNIHNAALREGNVGQSFCPQEDGCGVGVSVPMSFPRGWVLMPWVGYSHLGWVLILLLVGTHLQIYGPRYPRDTMGYS